MSNGGFNKHLYDSGSIFTDTWMVDSYGKCG